MRHPARVVALAVGLVIAALAVVLATQVSTDPRAEATRSRLLGKAVPGFALHDLDGREISAAGLYGKVVIVNFWNTWCIPCEQELPALKAFYADHAQDEGFVLVGIVRDDTEGAVRAHVAAEGIRWTVAMDPKSVAALAFGTRGQPETFAISRGGQIVGSKNGPSSVRTLEELLAAARAR